MKKLFTGIIILTLFSQLSVAQMWNGQDSLYGNEWINFNQDYYKIMVAEDGIYRIPYETLNASGLPLNNINGSGFQLYYMGEEIPLYTTSNQNFEPGDYIEFYGQKNRSELDRHLFKDPDSEMLNPHYSLFTDTSAYFLTWINSSATKRYQAIQNDLNNLPAKEEYFIHDELVNLHSNMVQESNSDAISYSSFERVEGFAEALRRTNTITFDVPAIYASGPESNLFMRLATNAADHSLEIRMNNSPIITDDFNGFFLKEYNHPIATNNLPGEITLRFRGLFNNQDRNAPSNIILSYPRQFDFGGTENFQFELAGGNQRRYLEISNFISGSSPVVYDLTNRLRIIAENNGTVTRISLPASTADRQVHISGSEAGGIKTISSLESIEFVDYLQLDEEYIIISHPMLFDDGAGNNYVQKYADYRASQLGGGYNTHIVDIQQLYDQFAYGIHRTPLSIRNWGHFIKKFWTNPQYIFIIGKAREYSFSRTNEDFSLPFNQSFHVPTFGVPGADNLLLSNNISSFPIIPIGRIASSNPRDIRVYLDKVKLTEANVNLPQTYKDRSWMKRILHLSGGDPSIQAVIANYLESMAGVIEENEFGAEVTTFFKTSTDPVQISESEEIFDLINDGVSIITFFGHSGLGTFDFNIDNPDNYFNYGKYPVMFSLGCFSGNIHTSAVGISERFVFYEDKGSVAFIASTGQGFISVLRQFAEEYYSLLGDEMYGMGIGDILRRVILEFDGISSLTFRTLHQQFSLNGDPALRLNPLPGPDYVVDAGNVSFQPAVISTQLESYSINFEVTNIGKNISDSIVVKIEQQFPSGDRVTLIQDKIETPAFAGKLSYEIPSFGKIAAGLNRFFITVDVENDVEELPMPEAEMNNRLLETNGQEGISLFIADNSLQPVFPKDFGIVSDPDLSFKSSTRNALIAEQKYLIELDTTELFNSPFKKRTEITQVGGLVEWNPDIAFENGRVYYWRVSPDSLSEELGFVWESSSFIFLDNEEGGWNQSHYYQYKKDDFDGLVVKQGEEFEFLVNGFFITIRNKVNEPNGDSQFIYNFETPAVSVRPWRYINAGVAVCVGDSLTGALWQNGPGGDYGSFQNNGFSRVFSFKTETVDQRSDLINFLENVVPDKSYVYVFSVLDDDTQAYFPELWAQDSVDLGTNLFQVLESQGATKLRSLENLGSVPFSFIYQKDGPVLAEDVASSRSEELVTEVFIPVLRTDGTIQSVNIGPASQWISLSWALQGNIDTSDISFVTVTGIGKTQNEEILADSITAFDTSLEFIDSEKYPFIKLSFHSKDEVSRTAPNLEYWRVSYQGVPEVAVNSSDHLVVYNDTIQQGEDFRFEIALENIGEYAMDSLLVNFSLSDAQNANVTTSERIAPLGVGESQNIIFNSDTRNIQGPVDFVLEVNPSDDQPELYHFNNFASLQFRVNADEKNPLLEVTFDGVHIMNGDLVSSKPEIIISLKDDNPFLLLEDTSLIRMYITDPNLVTRPQYFDSDTVNFFPATDSRNRARIEIRPELLMDGTYTLIVQAEDVTGNQSGALDYKVNFEVITKKSISNILNYPNPFSTSTQFVYTLTGDESPENFKIQIFTVSGKVVKEITETEIGPLKPGTHRTEYAWDGTDDYGAQLANGVYLYRVVAKDEEGEDIERYNTNINHFFKEGFGKLVIMR